MAKICAQSDLVVTTAKLFGRKAPILLTRAMLAGMKPGSVVADLALEGGGNTEGAIAGEDVVTPEGVTVLGETCFERLVATHASQVLSANFTAWITHFWDADQKTLRLDREDEILKGCLLTHGGAIVHPQFASQQT
jgi:NAD(P) transhydrogenase subunit alpha